ncbi:MAG: zf-TFIIB domain-containing protein [Acidobacteriota bacterium]
MMALFSSGILLTAPSLILSSRSFRFIFSLLLRPHRTGLPETNPDAVRVLFTECISTAGERTSYQAGLFLPPSAGIRVHRPMEKVEENKYRWRAERPATIRSAGAVRVCNTTGAILDSLLVMARTLQCPSCGGRLDPDARACPQCGSTVATRRCGVCFAFNLSSSHNCRHCGKILPREDDANRPQKLDCCACGAAMTSRKLDNTAFDECDHCGGLWLSPETVGEMRSRAETRARLRPFDLLPRRADTRGPAPAVKYRKCPVCSKLMNRANYAQVSGVIVDVCKKHGSYFDQGELTRIFHFVESGGLEKLRRRQEERPRARQGDERRKALKIGAVDPNQKVPDVLTGNFRGLDLLGWLVDLF